MDELRPNLVGGLLGLQQGLLEDHALSHGNLQHSSQDTKFMSLQDNRLMGISSHENRLLGLSQDVRSSVSTDNKNAGQRKCSNTPEDFSALYGGLSTSGIGDTSSHHHTPAHTPPSSRLADHSITGKTIKMKKKKKKKKNDLIEWNFTFIVYHIGHCVHCILWSIGTLLFIMRMSR